MTTKDFDKLGNECITHLTALNPKGGIKVFVRMAVEFGYQRAVKNLTIPRVFWNNPYPEVIEWELTKEKEIIFRYVPNVA